MGSAKEFGNTIRSMVLRNIMTFLLVFSCRISFGGNYTSYEISKLGLFALDCSNRTLHVVLLYSTENISLLPYTV